MNRGITPRQAKQFYDRFGAKQDSQGWYEDPAVDRMVEEANFGAAANVFELGHGTGRLAERLLRTELSSRCRYTGVEVSDTMHTLAESRLHPWADRVSLITADPEAPPLVAMSEGFDRLVATYVIDLMEVAHIRTTLAEAWRMLDPGGLLCIVSLTHGHSPFSRIVSWLWERVHAVAPVGVGGCRPISPSQFIVADDRPWQIDHASVVCRFGVCSEIVIASVPR